MPNPLSLSDVAVTLNKSAKEIKVRAVVTRCEASGKGHRVQLAELDEAENTVGQLQGFIPDWVWKKRSIPVVPAEVVVAGRVRMHPLFGFSLFVTRLERVSAFRSSKPSPLRRNTHVPGWPVMIITPANSRALADIRHNLNSHVKVDTEPMSFGYEASSAAERLKQTLHRLGSSGYRLVVITRGGGLASQLAVFDSHSVAAAIADAPVAVWMAVGHADDRHRSDIVAQRSLSTPTEAAYALNLLAGEPTEKLRQHGQPPTGSSGRSNPSGSQSRVAARKRRPRFNKRSSTHSQRTGRRRLVATIVLVVLSFALIALFFLAL